MLPLGSLPVVRNQVTLSSFKRTALATGVRDGSAGKCFSRGPGFSSEHPQNFSQKIATPVLGNLNPSSDIQDNLMWDSLLYLVNMFYYHIG